MIKLSDVMTDLIGAGTRRAPSVRDPIRIYASELGKPLIDVYLDMKGVPYTNPVNGAGMMKFLLGKYTEKALVDMLETTGLGFTTQEEIKLKLPGLITISGRPDIVMEVQGWDTVANRISLMNPKEYAVDGMLKMVEILTKEHPNGIPKTVFEVKSISSRGYAFAKNNLREEYKNYFLQCYVYMKHYGVNGAVVFVNKETFNIHQVDITYPDNELEEEMVKYLEKITYYIEKDIIPDPPPLKEVNAWGNEQTNHLISWSKYKQYILDRL